MNRRTRNTPTRHNFQTPPRPTMRHSNTPNDLDIMHHSKLGGYEAHSPLEEDFSMEVPLEPEKQSTRQDRLRILRQDSLALNLPETACFIGEKLMTTTESFIDVYETALCYYQERQYERALEMLNKKQTINKSVKARYLAALCSLALGNARDVLDYLGQKNPFSGKNAAKGFKMGLTKDDSEHESEGSIKLESVMCYARGKAYMLLKDIENARECFKEALSVDLKCYDALESLIKYNMMGEQAEEWEFVMTLPFDAHCGLDAEYFRYLYSLKLKKNIYSERMIEPDANKLAKSLDVQSSKAERHFSEGSYDACLRICKNIRNMDPYFKESIYLYLACLYELDLKTELYEYAQELINKTNHDDVAWHAVGLYYLYIKKNELAKRYFTQAINVNQFSQYSWLGYAHSLSAEKDHDQAINAYMTCTKHMPGYTEARDNLHIALKFAKKRNYKKNIFWEKLWCNLGHVYRHEPLNNLDRAQSCFENALNRNQKNADARASLGMIYQLKGCTAQAILAYQQALLDTEHNQVIQELLDQSLLLNERSFGYQYPLLPDAFDIFEMALQKRKDEVQVELDWENGEPDEPSMMEQDQEDRESIISDEGDLKFGQKWL